MIASRLLVWAGLALFAGPGGARPVNEAAGLRGHCAQFVVLGQDRVAHCAGVAINHVDNFGRTHFRFREAGDNGAVVTFVGFSKKEIEQGDTTTSPIDTVVLSRGRGEPVRYKVDGACRYGGPPGKLEITCQAYGPGGATFKGSLLSQGALPFMTQF